MPEELLVRSAGYVPDDSQHWRTNAHSNPHWELVVAVGNRLHFQRGTRKLVLNEGHFLILWPNEVHRSWGNHPSSHGFYFAQFAASVETFDNKVQCSIDDERILLPAHGYSTAPEVPKLFAAIVRETTTRSPHYRLKIRTLFTDILITLARQHQSFDHGAETVQVTSPKRAEAVYRVRRFLEENYRRPLGATDIAHGVNLSYEYACRIFRQAMGMTIVEYINHLRIEEAQVLLVELKEGQTIAQVSELLGFNDPSYFSRVFRQIVGSSPSEYIRHSYGRSLAK